MHYSSSTVLYTTVPLCIPSLCRTRTGEILQEVPCFIFCVFNLRIYFMFSQFSPHRYLGGPSSRGFIPSPPPCPCLDYLSRVGFSPLPQLAEFSSEFAFVACARGFRDGGRHQQKVSTEVSVNREPDHRASVNALRFLSFATVSKHLPNPVRTHPRCFSAAFYTQGGRKRRVTCLSFKPFVSLFSVGRGILSRSPLCAASFLFVGSVIRRVWEVSYFALTVSCVAQSASTLKMAPRFLNGVRTLGQI